MNALDYERRNGRRGPRNRPAAHARASPSRRKRPRLPGVLGGLASAPEQPHLTDPDAGPRDWSPTGRGRCAGGGHRPGPSPPAGGWCGSSSNHLERLRKAVPVPLVLHGASSVAPEDLRAAIAHGIRKINVGSILKRRHFSALRDACAAVPPEANPYEIIGSGTARNVEALARRALQERRRRMDAAIRQCGKSVISSRGACRVFPSPPAPSPR